MKKELKIAVLALFILIGIAGALAVLISPKNLGTSSEVPWGLLIGVYVFFAVSSTGVGFISSLSPLFGVKKYQKISEKTPLISLILLLCGFGALALELGRPLNMLYFLISPNYTAPIWWMGIFYSIYLLILIIQIILTIKNLQNALPMIERVAFFVKIAAVSTLGMVFSMNASRPFWQGAYSPIIMIIAAIASGAAILSIICYFDETFAGYDILPDMGKILLGAVLVLGIGSIFKIISTLFNASPENTWPAILLLSGSRALSFWLFELCIGIIVPAVLLIKWKFSRDMVLYSSILALVGLVAGRLTFISAGQMNPLFPRDQFVYFNAYSPSLSEWAILLGAVGIAILLIVTLGKKFANLSH
jgi:molybdopterin-containing oxidoreductase family membrane subunit